MSSPITTHVLDTSLGQPATGIAARLEHQNETQWTEIGSGVTNADGRITDLIKREQFVAGIYRLSFDTAAYFSQTGSVGFYPMVRIEFEIEDPGQHYHVPLLLSPFGYSTYRGS